MGVELSRVVGDALIRRGWTVALAESCTGGLVSKLLTDVPGSSKYLKGAVVAYANQAKIELLGVDPSSIDAHGSVSEEVAVQMAAGAARAFRSEVGLALTGIAGPTGASAEKPVGTVSFALSAPEGSCVETVRFSGDRAAVRVDAAERALRLLIRAAERVA